MAKQKRIEHCVACSIEGQIDTCGQLKQTQRILANVAATEVAAFTYSDWFHAQTAQRGDRVARAVDLGRPLTVEERNDWRYSVMPSLMPKRP